MVPHRRTLMRLLAACSLAIPAATAIAAPATAPPRLPRAPRCPVFPASSPWNQRVDALPVAADSARTITSIGAGATLHPDFGTGRIGIPYTTVGKGTKK